MSEVKQIKTENIEVRQKHKHLFYVFLIFILYIETFASVYICASLCAWCLRGPEAILDPLDLE